MEHIVNAAGTRFMHLLGNVLKVKVGKCIAGYQSNMVENNFIIANKCTSSFVMIMRIVLRVNLIILARAGNNPFNLLNTVAQLIPQFTRVLPPQTHTFFKLLLRNEELTRNYISKMNHFEFLTFLGGADRSVYDKS